MGTQRLRLGQLLVDARMISQDALEEVLAMQRTDGRRLGTLLVEQGLINETQLTQILSHQLAVPWVSLLHIEFSRQLLNLVPHDVAERFCLVPIYVRHVRNQGETLYVAMDDPTNEDGLRECMTFSGLPVRAMIAPPSDIRNAIRVYYGARARSVMPPPATDPPRAPHTEPDPRTHPAVAALAEKEELAEATLEALAEPPEDLGPTIEATEVDRGEVFGDEEEGARQALLEDDDGSRPTLVVEPPAELIAESQPRPELRAFTRPFDTDFLDVPLGGVDDPTPTPDGDADPGQGEAVEAPLEESQAGEAPLEEAQAGEAPLEEAQAGEAPLDDARGDDGYPTLATAAYEVPSHDRSEQDPPSERTVENIPPPPRRGHRMVSLTLLDGTTITLPARGAGARKERRRPSAPPSEPPPTEDAGLTARDMVSALRAVSHGADASEILGDNVRWESMFAALLSLLLKKHLIADWEFVDELKKF